MLHQPINEEPAVLAAVADFRETVVAIRGHSLRLFELPQGGEERAAEQERVDDLVAGMQARCDRIGITIDDLFRLVNLDLRRSGASAARPTGEFLEAIYSAAVEARAAEAEAGRALAAAESQAAAAAANRLTAERACAGYAADWMTQ